MIQFIAGAAGAGLLIGSLSTWYLTAEYKDATWSAAVNQQQVDAAGVLQAATVKAMETERAAQVKVRELEAQHDQEEAALVVIESRNRELARQLGGLRDPGRRTSGADAVPGHATSTDGIATAASTGQLSAEASEVLLSAAAEVDGIALYAKTCYEYVQSLQPTRDVAE